MQENTEVIADNTAPEFESVTGGDEIHQGLEAFFAAQEQPQIQQVDNLAENEDTTETVEQTEETAEETDKSVEETTEENTENADPVEESANFAALENPAQENAPVDYPTIEALKAKYPRQNKEFYEEAARYAADAQKGTEVISKLGGEEFIEPVATIATGIKEGNTSKIFQGVIEASSPDALIDVIGNALNLAFVKSNGFINDTDENLKLFGEKLQAAADVVIKDRFGDDVSFADLESLSEFQRHGWLEAISRWKEAGYVDPDEFDELCEGDKEPAKFQSLKQQLADAKSQLEQSQAKLKADESSKVAQIEHDFDKENGEALEKVLQDVVWKTSTLRDVKGDSAEMKEEKQFLREVLKNEALDALKTSTARKDLLENFKSGKKTTDGYGKNLSLAISSAILQGKEKTAVFERIIAKLYATTRNGNLKLSTPETEAEKLPPTQTTKPVTNKPKSVQEIEKELEAAFAGQ